MAWRMLPIVLIGLAGCADPALIEPTETITGDCERPEGISNPSSGSEDWSLETVTLSFPAGAYDVALPLPVSSDGTNIQDWIEASEGAADRWQTERGTLARTSGTGPATVTWCVVQPAYGGNGCCAEQYLDARFITERGDGPLLVDVVFFEPGSVELAWEAISDYCGADGGFTASGSGAVSVEAQHGAWCT